MNEMLHRQSIATICLVTFFAGMLFFGWYYEYIIIRRPSHDSIILQNQTLKKSSLLVFIHNQAWRTLNQEMLISGDIASDCKQLLIQLSNTLVEEKIIPKAFSIQTCMYTAAQELYISFDKNPLTKIISIEKKLEIIESILATLRINEYPVKMVYFLSHHQPLQDSQLDFSSYWPIEGFMHEAASA